MDFSFDDETIQIFNLIKSNNYHGDSFSIPVFDRITQIAVLRPITQAHLEPTSENCEIVRLLTEWRKNNQKWYPSVFKVSEEGTKIWLRNQLIDMDDRILFLIESMNGEIFGHMGLFRGEIDNVLRGKPGIVNRGMTFGLLSMMKWGFTDLGLNNLRLRVFCDNDKAIQFYENCGFTRIGRIPLKKIEEGDTLKWIPDTEVDIYHAERTFCLMENDLKNIV